MSSNKSSHPLASNFPDASQEMLLKAALFSGEEAIENWKTWSGSVDIDTLDGASFRLLPLLHANLVKHNITTPAIGKLKGISRFHWCKNQILINKMLSLIAALRNEQIDVMVLKGGALIFQYYKSSALRPMSDFDIMIPRDKIADAVALMQEIGWKPVGKLMISDPAVQAKRHGQSFVDGQGNECDLHWTPLFTATWDRAEALFWETSEEIQVKENVFRVLGPTEQLFHTVIHGGYYNQMPPIRWVADAWLILEQEPNRIDWKHLLELGTIYSYTTILQRGLLYLSTDFGANIPPEILSMISNKKITLREKIEIRALSKKIPSYRIDLLLLKIWFRHSQQRNNASFLSQLATFPSFFKAYISIEKWSQLPSFIVKRYRGI